MGGSRVVGGLLLSLWAATDRASVLGMLLRRRRWETLLHHTSSSPLPATPSTQHGFQGSLQEPRAFRHRSESIHCSSSDQRDRRYERKLLGISISCLSLVEKYGVLPSEYDLYGSIKCKIHLSVRDRLAHQKDGYYVVTTGINPTPLGEGKSTTTIGMYSALSRGIYKVILNRSCSSSWSSSWQEGHCLHSPTFSRPHLRYQGRCCWWRICSGHSYGGVQPPFDWRHPRDRSSQ